MISIQILRGIAALAVVFFHIGRKAESTGIVTGNFFEAGKYGVDLFFIISGFIMAYITHGKDINLYSFIKKRIIRIIPIYWILTTVALAVFLISPSSVNSTLEEPGIINSYFLFPVEGFSMLLAVGWTLRYEFIFYFIFAICLTTKHRYTLALLTLSLIWIGSLFNHDNYYVNFLLSGYMMEFAFGIIAFLAYKNNKKIFSLIVALLLFFISITTIHKNEILIVGSLCYAFFIIIISLDSSIKNKKLRPLAYIGDSSYTLYLSHLFVIAATGISTKHIPIMNNPYFFMAVTLLATLAFSSLFYELVEKKVTKLFTNRKQARDGISV
jgi:peptidoglycan/LPS O-acetylase OafA/YrhL